MIRPSLIAGGMRRGRGRGQAVAEAAGSFADGHDLFGLEGNESFSPSSPTLKDGTSVSGDMADYLAAYAYWRDNQENAHADTKLTNVMGSTNNYTAARRGQTIHDVVSRAFRLTGDLRDLDYLCAGYDVLQSSLDTGGAGGGPRIEWDAGWENESLVESECGTDDAWSPYRKLNGGGSSGGPTDLNRLNVLKLWALVAEFTWMLHLNQGKTSPGSVDYATRLTYWKARLEEFVRAWSLDTADCWANNYIGVDGDGGLSGVPNISSSRSRQEWGKYPFATRDEGHAIWNTIMAHRYIGLLGQHASLDILNPDDALTAAEAMVNAIRDNGSYKACSNADHGDSLVMTWTNPLRGDTSVPMRMTYTGYQGASLLQLWLTGAYRTKWSLTDMQHLGSAFAWAHDGVSGDTHGNITRGAAECGLDAVSDTGRSASDNSVRGFAALPIVFDPGGAKMTDIADNLITLSGGLSTPDRAAVFSALFVREALSAAGDIS